MSTVKVTCPCGTVFDRPVKRGRPAIWCEKCRLLPVPQRPERVIELGDDGEPVVAEAQVSRYGQDDDMNYTQREAIEAGVAAVNQDYRDRVWPDRAKIFAKTSYMRAGKPDVDRMAHEWLHFAVYRVYNGVDSSRWGKGNLIGYVWDEWDAYA